MYKEPLQCVPLRGRRIPKSAPGGKEGETILFLKNDLEVWPSAEGVGEMLCSIRFFPLDSLSSSFPSYGIWNIARAHDWVEEPRRVREEAEIRVVTSRRDAR